MPPLFQMFQRSPVAKLRMFSRIKSMNISLKLITVKFHTVLNPRYLLGQNVASIAE
jgi:hypothetical protein